MTSGPHVVRYQLTYPRRPWTTNYERTAHWTRRRELVAEWRLAFFVLARNANIPTLSDASITVDVALRGPLQDPGGCHPAVKAAIDGIVDAKVLPDDTGEYLQAVVYHPPTRSKTDSLTLTLRGATT